MIIRKAVPAIVLATIPTAAIAGLTVQGPFLVADLTVVGDDWSAADQIAIVDSWEVLVAGLIADADTDTDIAAFSALKTAIVDLRQDVSREHYMRDAQTETPSIAVLVKATEVEDASDSDAGSHPTATGDAVISNASQHTADDENEETEHEAHEEEPRQQPRRRRGR